MHAAGMATVPQDKSPQPPQKAVGYDALRECHRKAYSHLTEALQIDEGGRGEDIERTSSSGYIASCSARDQR